MFGTSALQSSMAKPRLVIGTLGDDGPGKTTVIAAITKLLGAGSPREVNVHNIKMIGFVTNSCLLWKILPTVEGLFCVGICLSPPELSGVVGFHRVIVSDTYDWHVLCRSTLDGFLPRELQASLLWSMRLRGDTTFITTASPMTIMPST